MVDLNKTLKYSLEDKEYQPSDNERTKLENNPTYSKDDWGESKFSEIKGNIKGHLSAPQKRRCAYCRCQINVGGTGEPTDHIVPKKLKPTWMFIAKNLCLACWGCNSTKSEKDPLVNRAITYGNDPEHYPTRSGEFYIYHPYFDNWEDHFEIQDSFFLVPKPNTKGPYTYHELGMNRYEVVIDHKDQSRIHDPSSHRHLLKRIRKVKDPERVEV